MIPLYSIEQFKSCKSKEKLPCKCYNCSNTFWRTKHEIVKQINGTTKKNGVRFCSKTCFSISSRKYKVHYQDVICINCGDSFKKKTREIEKSPNHFCSHSCNATYNNTHKKHGIRKSKLETWLEQQLPSLYSNLEFHFNRKDAINSELDIYIPSLKLAFELNGIFHYEPIFGEEKLKKIQNNDERKFQACLENGIELCLIDVSLFSYFKEKGANKYLTIIKGLINKKQGKI